MTAPRSITELDEHGPFTGAGPHSIATHYAADSDTRFTIQCNIICKDAATRQIYNVFRCAVTKYDATNVSVTVPMQLFPATGSGGAWDGTVSVGASIVDNELILALTIPAGYTIEASYRIEGLTT